MSLLKNPLVLFGILLIIVGGLTFFFYQRTEEISNSIGTLEGNVRGVLQKYSDILEEQYSTIQKAKFEVENMKKMSVQQEPVIEKPRVLEPIMKVEETIENVETTEEPIMEIEGEEEHLTPEDINDFLKTLEEEHDDDDHIDEIDVQYLLQKAIERQNLYETQSTKSDIFDDTMSFNLDTISNGEEENNDDDFDIIYSETGETEGETEVVEEGNTDIIGETEEETETEGELDFEEDLKENTYNVTNIVDNLVSDVFETVKEEKKCVYMYKRGAKKNTTCGKKCVKNTKYCKKHM